jgi:hypothetical protein
MLVFVIVRFVGDYRTVKGEELFRSKTKADCDKVYKKFKEQYITDTVILLPADKKWNYLLPP